MQIRPARPDDAEAIQAWRDVGWWQRELQLPETPRTPVAVSLS